MRQNKSFMFAEDLFSKNLQGFILHESLFLLKFLHRKSQITNKNIN